MSKKTIDSAYKIAVESLRKCYSNRGILAGLNHFDDYWTRDSMFACLGALEIKDYDIVKKNLQLVLEHMRLNGQLPLRIGASTFKHIIKYFIRQNYEKKPIYQQDKLFSYPLDQNSLFLIVFEKYIESSKDHTFLKKEFELLETIAQWNIDQTRNHLIFGKKYTTWQDVIKKPGFSLYNNVLYFESLKAMDNMHKIVGNYTRYYKEKYEKVCMVLNELFWSKDHYIDWIYNKYYDYFSTDGNLFAVYYGLSNLTQSHNVLKYMIDTNILSPFGARTNFPKYKPWQTFMPFYLIGMGDYQNDGMIWLWLGCLAVITLKKMGYVKEAEYEMDKIAKVIIKYKTVYEVYNRDGTPVKRTFYKSEEPFAWSSSFFILAYNEIKEKKFKRSKNSKESKKSKSLKN